MDVPGEKTVPIDFQAYTVVKGQGQTGALTLSIDYSISDDSLIFSDI